LAPESTKIVEETIENVQDSPSQLSVGSLLEFLNHCQAEPKPKLNWLRLALFSFDPEIHPPTPPA